MEKVRQPKFKIVYDGRDITADITPNVLSISYTDNDEKEADEIDISVEDVEANWRNSWYPVKGSTIELSLGYADDGVLVDCGIFEIDEITLQGPPDTINIRAISTTFASAMRTKKSKSFENQTLKQIAQYIATKNGLTLIGNIATINLTRVTQNREKDLSFLARIAEEYGYIFSVKGKSLVFTSMVEIESGKPVLSMDRAQLRNYSLKDKTSETYAGADVSYLSPTDGQVKSGTAKVNTEENKDGVTYKQIVSGDTLVVRTKSESPSQAQIKAKAALYRKNSNQRTGTLNLEGTPLLVAGNSFTLTGFGVLSGKYYIKKSNHRIDKGSGYTTSVEIKQITAAPAAQQSKQASAKKVDKPKYEVQNLTNKDNVTYKQITPAK